MWNFNRNRLERRNYVSPQKNNNSLRVSFRVIKKIFLIKFWKTLRLMTFWRDVTSKTFIVNWSYVSLSKFRLLIKMIGKNFKIFLTLWIIQILLRVSPICVLLTYNSFIFLCENELLISNFIFCISLTLTCNHMQRSTMIF